MQRDRKRGAIITDSIIKFSFVALCFIIALGSNRICYSKKDWGYLVSAMGFTLVSDFFLVLVHNYRAGVFTFCFVHIIYIFRVSDNKVKSVFKIFTTIFSGILVFVFFNLFPFLPQLDILVIFAMVYAYLFVQNLATHIRYYRRDDANALPLINRRLMLIGLILFALCDVHVLLFNLPQHIPYFPQALADWGLTWIWVFYAPSQLLLSISAVKFHSPNFLKKV